MDKRLILISNGESTTISIMDVAESAAEKTAGFAGRDPESDAVLFKYAVATYKPFWMKDVAEDLFIAWFDEEGYFIGSRVMQAGSTEAVIAPKPFFYAVEWPADQCPGLTTGDRLVVPW